MVAVVKSGCSIQKTFFYNENKLDVLTTINGKQLPAAELLYACNYPMDGEAMSRQQRLNMLLKTYHKNPIDRPSIHISLNFAPGEDHSKELLQKIADDYMQAIGFGDQPYLVYKHNDAAHPHIHLVSLRVKPDGDLIDTFRIGMLKSEPARKMLEEKYNLVKAEQHKRMVFRLPPVNINKVIYSETLTKRAITTVLDFVLPRYKYTSLASLNAVLNGYNIHADRGTENSRIYKNYGLVYRILDAQGKPKGVYIPASHIHSEPTLKRLERRFKRNSSFTKTERERVTTAVDLLLNPSAKISIKQLEKRLLAQGIRLVVRQNKTGQIYGVTYIDHKTRCVFNGSDLGKEYSANAIQMRCLNQLAPSANEHITSLNDSHQAQSATDNIGILDLLMQPENTYEPLPYQLKGKKKKRKKRKPDNL